jgi:hypothetical protein
MAAMILGAIVKEIEKVICQNMAVMFDRKSDRLIDSIGRTIQTKLDSSKEFETMVRTKIESVIAEKLNMYYDLDKNPDVAKALKGLIEPIIEKALVTTLQPLLETAITNTMAKYEQRAAAQGPVQGLKAGGQRRLRSRRSRNNRSQQTRQQRSRPWGRRRRMTRSHRTI